MGTEAYPTPTNARKGRFRARKWHFARNPAGTFHPDNDLAENRPQFSDVTDHDWRERYGRVNEHNGWVPRDFWLEDWEKQAIVNFHLKNPLEGYRRLTFMMLDADIVAVSPSSVWRVLGQAGLLGKWNGKPSKKGTGFVQPPQPHEHWHIDVSYINISGTFYYLCSVLDGYSRFIVHWDLRVHDGGGH